MRAGTSHHEQMRKFHHQLYRPLKTETETVPEAADTIESCQVCCAGN